MSASSRPEKRAGKAAPGVDRFPLIVTPVQLGWFDRPDYTGLTSVTKLNCNFCGRFVVGLKERIEK